MKAIINKLCINENFIEIIKDKVSAKVIGQPGMVIDYYNGQSYGGVGNYEIISDINFKDIHIQGLRASLSLEFTGEANINYKTYHSPDDETYGEKDLQGFGTASVLVMFSKKVSIIEDIDDIIENLKIEVTECSAYVYEDLNNELNEEMSDELIDQAAEEAEKDYQKHLERKTKLQSLSFDNLADKIIFLEDKIIFLEDKVTRLKDEIVQLKNKQATE